MQEAPHVGAGDCYRLELKVESQTSGLIGGLAFTRSLERFAIERETRPSTVRV
jgi:hypothetical protein